MITIHHMSITETEPNLLLSYYKNVNQIIHYAFNDYNVANLRDIKDVCDIGVWKPKKGKTGV